MARLVLVPFGRVSPDILWTLRTRLGGILPHDVVPASVNLGPGPAWDEGRGQFLSTRLLEMLVRAQEVDAGDRILGVIDEDLFIPILTFVFGEAQLEGPAAVFSLTRLRASFYGLPDNPTQFVERAVKEALHEVGHTFGLYHCPRTDCVMRASTSAEEVDLKPAKFCRACRKAL